MGFFGGFQEAGARCGDVGGCAGEGGGGVGLATLAEAVSRKRLNLRASRAALITKKLLFHWTSLGCAASCLVNSKKNTL